MLALLKWHFTFAKMPPLFRPPLRGNNLFENPAVLEVLKTSRQNYYLASNYDLTKESY